MIWVMILLAAILLNFAPHRLINTNYSHVYRGLVIVSVAAVIGLASHNVIAATVLVVGLLIAIYGKSYEHPNN